MELYIKTNANDEIIKYRLISNDKMNNYQKIDVPDNIADDIFSGNVTYFKNNLLIYKNGATFDINNIEKEELRKQRKTLLQAFDIWEKAVIRGREQESQAIMSWYQDLLDLKASAFENENIPEKIKYYM